MGSLRSLASEKRKALRPAFIEIHVRDYIPACYDWRSVPLDDLEEARRVVDSLKDHDIEVSYYKSLTNIPDVYDYIPYYKWWFGWFTHGELVGYIIRRRYWEVLDL